MVVVVYLFAYVEDYDYCIHAINNKVLQVILNQPIPDKIKHGRARFLFGIGWFASIITFTSFISMYICVMNFVYVEVQIDSPLNLIDNHFRLAGDSNVWPVLMEERMVQMRFYNAEALLHITDIIYTFSFSQI